MSSRGSERAGGAGPEGVPGREEEEGPAEGPAAAEGGPRAAAGGRVWGRAGVRGVSLGHAVCFM